MTDTHTEKQRSRNMSRIKSKDTSPEMRVRRTLHGMGYRYRLHVKKLPGKPDIVISKYDTVIFVNGCFWHQHKDCKKSSLPKSNRDYWLPKLKRNVERQKENIKALKKKGWRVIVLWECKIKEAESLEEKLDKLLQ